MRARFSPPPTMRRPRAGRPCCKRSWPGRNFATSGKPPYPIMNLCNHRQIVTTRRDFLRTTSAGFGWLAFAALQAAENKRYVSPLAPKPTHHQARAKRVIFMFMNGGPSHLETFDWKPELKRVGAGGNHQ